ncbi:MAG: zinc ABC transporter substrate-binding protein [Bacteroidetes bacterium]|nr:zinc ABC transporter substrate-binding protein [Bacteroidota bacterium]
MRKFILTLTVALISLVSCNNSAKNIDNQQKVITVSVLPQKYFVERIVGEQFTINVMIPPGASPVTYEPSPKQMKDLVHSEVYIRIGHIEFEKSWMKKLQSINPEMDIIDQSEVATLIEPEHEHGHDHHHEGHHHHGVDPHIWTSPKQVKKQIEFIYQYFTKQYPEYASEFTTNYNLFVNQVDSLDQYVSQTLEPHRSKKFLIFHPALSYIARDYGLQQISIEIDGKEPTPSNIQEIIEVAKSENIKVVFIQRQFSTHNAEVIAKEIGGSVVQIDPLDYNWAQSITMITNEIAKSYSE